MLEDAGYIREDGPRLRADAAGRPQDRREGAHATSSPHLNKDRIGQHELRPTTAVAGDRTDVTKPTSSAIRSCSICKDGDERGAAGQERSASRRCSSQPRDFEVYRTELTVRESLDGADDRHEPLDVLHGCFTRRQAGRAGARLADPRQVSRATTCTSSASRTWRRRSSRTTADLTWNECSYGTNMQHGFLLARQILARHKGGNRQIIMITDGEPTAHFEERQSTSPIRRPRGRSRRRCGRCVRCTRDGITHQHVHAGAVAVPDAVRQRPDRRSTAAASSSPRPTGSASTSWSTTSPTSASGYSERLIPFWPFSCAIGATRVGVECL